jgi:7-keto-8-aminopelargonate synthetase-like enzyme
MNMGINKLWRKLDDFLDLSKQKQEKKHNKLLNIITKLEAKKLELEQEVIEESKVDDTSNKYLELSKKLNVVSNLIRKAKKHDLAGEE